MRKYYLWASTYESTELMERHQKSDVALELLFDRVSDPYDARAESLQDAAQQFQESTQFAAFLSRNAGKPVFTYGINDIGVLVRVEM